MGFKEGNQNTCCDSWIILAGLAFLQYQQIATMHWHKLQGAITRLAATATTTSTINDNNNVAVAMMSNLGIPLTSSMSVGFTIGFMKGWNKKWVVLQRNWLN
jgi:hypothetical protein